MFMFTHVALIAQGVPIDISFTAETIIANLYFSSFKFF